MSGIFGILNLDGRETSRANLLGMRDALRHRGIDRGLWIDGPVGLGHLSPRPASKLQECATSVTRDRDLAIAADARIDNRDELLAQFAIGSGAQISDEELILEAYRRWGENCAEKLLGDFAFAIWDARRQSLFCARDHFGVRPFYYYLARDRTFEFSSEVKGLLALPDTPHRPNKVRIGDYLADIFADGEATFYQDIWRLPAAHCLTVNVREFKKRRYWTLNPGNEISFRRNADYDEAFLEVFTEAVRCRLRSTGPLGSMLSGGLDSSAITCVASDLERAKGAPGLRTFSAVFDSVAQCDERPFINSVIARNGVDPHFVTADTRGPFSNLQRIQWHQDQPASGPNCNMVWSIYESAASQCASVLLDGHDGDTTVSYGTQYLHELARAGNWISLTRELGGLARLHGGSTWGSLKSFVWRYRIDPLFGACAPLRAGRRVWRRYLVANRQVSATQGRSLLNPQLADEVDMPARYRAWKQSVGQTATTEREAHHRALSHPMQAFALETHDSTAAAFGIEKRYPFWDRRLVEFCLALPSAQKLSRGWDRVVMRRALNGIVPDSIQWRRDKTNFAESLAYGIRKFERQRLDAILRHAGLLAEYLSLPALREACNRFLKDETNFLPTDLFSIWKAISLAGWLEQHWPESVRAAPDSERG